jgi:predicted LPLAT superfamily acyltransferase
MSDGATAVLVAAEKGHLEVVRALASRGAKMNVPMSDRAISLRLLSLGL